MSSIFMQLSFYICLNEFSSRLVTGPVCLSTDPSREHSRVLPLCLLDSLELKVLKAMSSVPLLLSFFLSSFLISMNSLSRSFLFFLRFEFRNDQCFSGPPPKQYRFSFPTTPWPPAGRPETPQAMFNGLEIALELWQYPCSFAFSAFSAELFLNAG